MKNSKSDLGRRNFLQGIGASAIALGITSGNRKLFAANPREPGQRNPPANQDISLSGTVLDIKSGKPLKGAEVSLSTLALKDVTDEQGKFSIFGQATPGTDTPAMGTLHGSKSGYLDLDKPLTSLDQKDMVLEMGKTDEFEGGWAKVPGILAAITQPEFRDIDFPVTEYGAKSNGFGNNYMAFKKAVEACHSAGGGRVVVPSGTYRMEGPIHLLSNVNLHLDQGAKLNFYWHPKGYLIGDETHRGRVPVRWEGTWLYNFSPLIYAWNQENIGITGHGEINGNGLRKDWPNHGDKTLKNNWAHAGVPIDERIADDLTPGTIEFYFCRNILLEGFTSSEPNERNVHPVMCSNVTIRGLDILPSNATQKEDDGIDPDSCQYVLIENCRIHSYDDNIGIKSGRDNDGWIKEIEDPGGKWYQEIPGQPSKNILIRNNWFQGGDHNMVGVGSDQSGGVEDIFAWNCRIGQEMAQDNVLEIKANGNRGGDVHDIYIRDIEARNLKWVLTINHHYSPKSFAPNGPQRLPRAHHIYIENVTVQNGGLIGFVFKGDDNEPLHDFYFRNISIPEGKTAEYRGVKRETITAINVDVNGMEWQPLRD